MIILKCMIHKYGMNTWTGSKWLSRGSSGRNTVLDPL